jgi:hypothetical protein
MCGRQCLLAVVPAVLAACGGGHGVADGFSGTWRLRDGRTIAIRRVSAAVGMPAMRALKATPCAAPAVYFRATYERFVAIVHGDGHVPFRIVAVGTRAP